MTPPMSDEEWRARQKECPVCGAGKLRTCKTSRTDVEAGRAEIMGVPCAAHEQRKRL